VSAIQVSQVRKHFKGVEVLKTVDLQVHDQEFCVLLGPSGCGKTTLLRMIAGLEQADGGEIAINGRSVIGLPPRQRGIAMVFQNYAVFPHMTIFENIAFGLRMKNTADDVVKKQVSRAAELMHISHLLERYSGQLSGGQRQRVAVARAIAVGPDVLLMDEPLSNLDALLRLEMRTELKGLLREIKTTTIYVTHDQVEAMSLADRIAVMHAGQIEQYGVPAEIYTDPATQFVGSFIGNPPMNFIESLDTARQFGLTVPQGAQLLGVRPEDFEVSRHANGGLEVKAMVVEMLGASYQIATRLGGGLLRVVIAVGTPVSPGDVLYIKPHAAKVRWYDSAQRLMK
jgi:multiple sugar transport system ATP-binding protein